MSFLTPIGLHLGIKRRRFQIIVSSLYFHNIDHITSHPPSSPRYPQRYATHSHSKVLRYRLVSTANCHEWQPLRCEQELPEGIVLLRNLRDERRSITIKARHNKAITITTLCLTSFACWFFCYHEVGDDVAGTPISIQSHRR